MRWLRESGLVVEDRDPTGQVAARVDAILRVVAGNQTACFAVEVRRRAPYPNELDLLRRSRQHLAQWGEPLMVVPYVTEALGSALTAADWSWADAQGNFDLRAPGLVLRQRRATAAPRTRPRSLPRGSGSLAIIRALVHRGEAEEDEPGATALAAQAGVSQPRASQVLRQLHELELVVRTGRGHWQPRREALLDRFLAEYPGPGGSELYFYSLDSPTQVAVRASRISTSHRPIAASADVGPDLIVPWRRPSVVILYAGHAIDPANLELIEAQGKHDANVIIRLPDDKSVFPSHALMAQVGDVEIPLADPMQQIWDLEGLGGADRAEVAGKLRQWVLKRR